MASGAASALGPATPFHLPDDVIAGVGKPKDTLPKSGGARAGAQSQPSVGGSLPATPVGAATAAAATATPAKGSTEKGSGRKKSKRRDFSTPPAGRAFKTPRRGQPEAPGPAHSVEEYLANTQKGIEAVASITAGTGALRGSCAVCYVLGLLNFVGSRVCLRCTPPRETT